MFLGYLLLFITLVAGPLIGETERMMSTRLH